MRTTYRFKILLIGLMLIFLTLTAYGFNVDETDLVIHYSFDVETLVGEDVLDLSGNENSGFLHGNELNIVEGKVNECIELPGIGTEYISVRNVNYTEGIPELTVAVWIKTPQRGMIASWDRNEYFRFAAGDSVLGNTTFVAFDVCCPVADWHGDVEVTDDQWHHVAITFDAEMKRIYVDGELDVEAATLTENKMIGPKTQRFGFIGVGSEAAEFNGATAPTSWAYKGLLDEFLYFHRALSQQEVGHLANAPEDPFAIQPNNKLSAIWGNIKNSR